MSCRYNKIPYNRTEPLFTIMISMTEINEIVVTGTSKATEISKDPVPVILIENKELRAGAYSNKIDALVKIPGVSALTTGPNISKPFIHRPGFNRILTLFNGVRQEDPGYTILAEILMSGFLFL